MDPKIPADEVLATTPISPDAGDVLGLSRDGREIRGHRLGHGPVHVSLIAGCHADEPVGPAMLDRLAAFLAAQPADSPLCSACTWFLVPHTNPDGEARNTAWTVQPVDLGDGRRGYDLRRYAHHAVRELPGDDVEFGFPRHPDDAGARPENRAVAAFLRPGAPFALHASLHGMAFAAGPWFLLEAAWIERTAAMRAHLRRRVRELGYTVHDIDRRGDKGFHRIGEGFTTRPDSGAMRRHFDNAGDPETAALFRPSSMEFVRSLGADPLTLVSEMPLFLLPREIFEHGDPVRPAAVSELREAALDPDPQCLARAARRLGARPMPIDDQMRLQIEYLNAGLAAARDGGFQTAGATVI